MKKILTPFIKGKLMLKNHLVMAPMTRSRAINNIPNALMAEYYGQRTGAGLIITEGTAPAPEALGYPRIPGIFTGEQIDGWKKITSEVHKKQTIIFLQLMHTGRIGHVDNLSEGKTLVGASDLKAAGQIYTDTLGMQDYSSPIALTMQGVKEVIKGYVTAAKNAIQAGFDGVELHGANGYLPEQFLNPNVNNRTDEYGGDRINRSRIIIEIAEKISMAIGKGKVGIRFSPYSTLGDLQPYDENDVHETYANLAMELNRIGIAYIHISMNPNIPEKTTDAIRANFKGTIILANGLTPEIAELTLNEGFADLVAFGRSFLSNPDFVKRIENNSELNPVDFTTLYTPGSKGYTDYPVLELSQSF